MRTGAVDDRDSTQALDGGQRQQNAIPSITKEMPGNEQKDLYMLMRTVNDCISCVFAGAVDD